MKVLIVDDVAVNLKLLRAILESEKMEVCEAADGVQALALMERHEFDAVISDILMPHMDGYRLCQEVRKSKRWGKIPFIFHTATYTSPSDERLCYDLGGDAYLRKPATKGQILRALQDAQQLARENTDVRAVSVSEIDVMKEYNERLVSKLEQKNQELALAHTELEQANLELEWRVEQRTRELNFANQELESFCSSVSHDLRAPARHVSGFADILLRDCASKLGSDSVKHLHTIRHAAETMTQLIDALLELSRVTRAELSRRPVDLSSLAHDVVNELRHNDPKRVVEAQIEPDLRADGDPILLRVVLANLIGNAWKFSRKRPEAKIEFGLVPNRAEPTFFVRDNGAGFDMTYVKKLFHAFQRLHGAYEFEGTGIGLATVQRIIHRHNGSIRAESIVNQGATFYFTLNNAKNSLTQESPAIPVDQGSLSF